VVFDLDSSGLGWMLCGLAQYDSTLRRSSGECLVYLLHHKQKISYSWYTRGPKLTPDFKSGYDRGHMVPAADAKISQQAMDETFYLSNVAPQVGDGFNRHCELLALCLRQLCEVM
jgi:hypothetical protein